MNPENKDTDKAIRWKEGKSLPQSYKKRSNHLFLIAINDYDPTEFNPLNNCIKDAEDFAAVLLDKYLFEPDKVARLYDADATMGNIFKQLRNYAQHLGKNDNLIIYFSGHGDEDEILEEGYWIPQDGKADGRHNWLDNKRMIGILEKIKTHHTFLIVDSCFSGTLFFNAKSSSSRYDNAPSRYVITSGSKELVSDGPPGENSPFAKELIDFLRSEETEAIKASDIAHHLKGITFRNQTPNGSAIMMDGHKNGEFVFYKKTARFFTEEGETLATPSRSIYLPPKPKKASLYKQLLSSRSFFFLFSIIGVVALIVGFQAQTEIDIDMDVIAERISFTYLDGPQLFNDLACKELQVQPFSRISIPAQSIEFSNSQDPTSQPESHKVAGGISFTEDPLLGNASAIFNDVNILSLHFEPKVKFNLDILNFEDAGIKVDINSPEPLQMLMNSGSALDMDVQDVLVEGIERFEQADPFSSSVHLGGIAQNSIIEGTPGIFSMTLNLKESATLQGSQFRVGSLDFGKPEAGIQGQKRKISSIKQAQINYIHQDEAYKSIRLSESEDLFFEESDILYIQNLLVSPEGIKIKVKGTVTSLKGDGNYHPSRISYWWFTQKFLTLLFGISSLVLVLFFGWKAFIKK